VITLLAGNCDTSAMVLGIESPPFDNIWYYEINNALPYFYLDQFTGIPSCANLIGYKIYDDNNGLIENTDLNIEAY